MLLMVQMLMIRLSFQMQLDCLTLVHWLQLIREYYQDLLSRPVSELECNQDDTLEDSPFLLSLSVQDVHHLSLCHVQRQAVFLLIRCSLTLSDMWLRKSTADLNCDCMRPNSSFACELNAIKNCCAEKKGLLEFYGWLRGQVSNIFAEDKMYQEKCIKFASSFIRLYKNEVYFPASRKFLNAFCALRFMTSSSCLATFVSSPFRFAFLIHMVMFSVERHAYFVSHLGHELYVVTYEL